MTYNNNTASECRREDRDRRYYYFPVGKYTNGDRTP